MDLKPIRIERLKAFAKSRGLVDNPSGLGSLIGKEPNQVYNLLSGKASFGEKVARSIEEAAGLPRYWLDTDVQGERALSMLSPEAAAIARAIDGLQGDPRKKVILLCQQILGLAEPGRPENKNKDQGNAN
jgi:hypothetical protein